MFKHEKTNNMMRERERVPGWAGFLSSPKLVSVLLSFVCYAVYSWTWIVICRVFTDLNRMYSTCSSLHSKNNIFHVYIGCALHHANSARRSFRVDGMFDSRRMWSASSKIVYTWLKHRKQDKQRGPSQTSRCIFSNPLTFVGGCV